MTSDSDNFSFTPRPINSVGFRPAGAGLLISQAIIQRTIALRAYVAFSAGADWMAKLSSAYVVAIATRSADQMMMANIQAAVEASPGDCAACRKNSLGLDSIRRALFPRLADLRLHANALLHHLDHPGNRGVNTLNIEGIFEYCHHLFEENADLMFGAVPSQGIPIVKCKRCKAADEGARQKE